MKRRIGILTSGGDCPGLNATIRGVAKACYEMLGTENVEIVGISDGYYGLIHNICKEMSPDDFSGILTRGGTILGTKRQPFKMMKVIGDDNVDKVKNMKKTYQAQKLDCLLTLGGNGTHKTSKLLADEGLNVIGLPKTIDNDIYGTDVTFGFHTAVDIATDALDRLHTTANSHSRILLCEIMGNKAGWLTLNAGIAGGADIILIPEIPYDIDEVCKSVLKRSESGKNFSIIAVAEGCFDKEEAKLKKERENQTAAGGRHHNCHQSYCSSDSEKHRSGGTCLRTGAYAAWRQSQRIRPHSGNTVRRIRSRIDSGRALRNVCCKGRRRNYCKQAG